MNILERTLLSALTSFALAMLLSPLIVDIMKKLKGSQPISSFVEQHKTKSGTPTMGGFIFALPGAAVTFALTSWRSMGQIAAAVMLAMLILGFLDDFFKLKQKNNKGLRAYQKIIGQLAIAFIVAFFCYKNRYIGSAIHVPFTSTSWELSWFYIPFTMFAFIAIVNAVNLTDGIDGLAGGTFSVYSGVFSLIIMLMAADAAYYGAEVEGEQLSSLLVFSASMFGAVLAFLWKNTNPALIFMGDTGALALGAAAGCIAIFTGNTLLIPVLGIMYMLSCISVIVQVLSIKLRGRRVFLMAPYHHHLEKKGYGEAKIVTFYTLITVAAGLVSILSAAVGYHGIFS